MAGGKLQQTGSKHFTHTLKQFLGGRNNIPTSRLQAFHTHYTYAYAYSYTYLQGGRNNVPTTLFFLPYRTYPSKIVFK